MNGSLALLTDLYQLTMAYGYWRAGQDKDEAVFHLFFRETPFDGGFSIVAGLESVIGYLDALRFTAEDLEYLGGIAGSDGEPLFPPDFIAYLRAFRFTCSVDAIPEGTVVF